MISEKMMKCYSVFYIEQKTEFVLGMISNVKFI